MDNIKLVTAALQEYGVTEKPGSKHEERILEYFDATDHDWVRTDETAWCSAFMNHCAQEAGLEKTGALNARSWLEIGEEVEEPQLGDVVIFWREKRDSWKGHVGIYIGEDEKYIHCLGGNQRNEVNIKDYSKALLLGFRRLKKA